MLYDAILAYHVEGRVTSWSRQEDAARMVNLNKVHDPPDGRRDDWDGRPAYAQPTALVSSRVVQGV